MLSIVEENIITFTRLPYSVCLGYKLITIENINGKNVESEEFIKNPKVPMLVKERKELKYNARQRWELPQYTITSSTDLLKVWINNVELGINSYTYNPNLKMLSVNDTLHDTDTIEIEYSVDKIEIKKKTTNKVVFKIYPIFNNSHKIGQHTII